MRALSPIERMIDRATGYDPRAPKPPTPPEPPRPPREPGPPRRIQLSRRKGWRIPQDTVKVTRPGPWGNPFIVSPKAKPGTRSGAIYICVPTVEDAVACFREMLETIEREQPERFAETRRELRGKDLACWCRPGEPCHADALLALVNK